MPGGCRPEGQTPWHCLRFFLFFVRNYPNGKHNYPGTTCCHSNRARVHFLYPCEFTVQAPGATWLDFLIAWTEESKRPRAEVNERKPWSLMMISFKYTHTLQAKGGGALYLKKNLKGDTRTLGARCRLLTSLQNESQSSNTGKGYKKWNAGSLELHSSGLSAFAMASVWSSFYTVWPCYLSDFLSLRPSTSLVDDLPHCSGLFCISKCVARLESPVNWTEKTTSSWVERTFSPDT